MESSSQKKSRKTFFIFIVVVILLALFVAAYVIGIFDCLSNRSKIGMPMDWANIKDCSY